MLSKCANHDCAEIFRYLHLGKLFRIEVPAATELASPHRKKPVLRTEFFWLCESCAAQMTLVYSGELGVITRPLPTLRAGVGL